MPTASNAKLLLGAFDVEDVSLIAAIAETLWAVLIGRHPACETVLFYLISATDRTLFGLIHGMIAMYSHEARLGIMCALLEDGKQMPLGAAEDISATHIPAISVAGG